MRHIRGYTDNRHLSRRERKRLKDYARLQEKINPQYKECWECGGWMTWCDCCQMYTKTCCVDYGTCMCS